MGHLGGGDGFDGFGASRLQVARVACTKRLTPDKFDYYPAPRGAEMEDTALREVYRARQALNGRPIDLAVRSQTQLVCANGSHRRSLAIVGREHTMALGHRRVDNGEATG